MKKTRLALVDQETVDLDAAGPENSDQFDRLCLRVPGGWNEKAEKHKGKRVRPECGAL